MNFSIFHAYNHPLLRSIFIKTTSLRFQSVQDFAILSGEYPPPKNDVRGEGCIGGGAHDNLWEWEGEGAGGEGD